MSLVDRAFKSASDLREIADEMNRQGYKDAASAAREAASLLLVLAGKLET